MCRRFFLGDNQDLYTINFYNQIRGVDWPRCNNINDIKNLPQFVKFEIEANFPLLSKVLTNSLNTIV